MCILFHLALWLLLVNIVWGNNVELIHSSTVAVIEEGKIIPEIGSIEEAAVESNLDGLLLEKAVSTPTWRNIMFSKVTVKDYDSWLQSFVNLPASIYLSYMKLRKVEVVLYLQLLNPLIDNSKKNMLYTVDTNANNTFYELSVLGDCGGSYITYLDHAKLEGKHCCSLIDELFTAVITESTF